MYIKPQHLKPWDKVLALSLSRGGPWTFPHRYEAGKRILEEVFGLVVVEGKHTLADAERLYNNPQARAEDLMAGLRDQSIKAIISTIWGDESVRMLPFIDLEVIRQNPKIFMWYSDSTITNFMFQQAGVVSFSGPSIMAWFGENGWPFDYMVQSVQRSLFSIDPIGEILPNMEWRTCEHINRGNVELQSQKRKLNPSEGRRWVQWNGQHTGVLSWWCIDVFPFMQGTKIRPQASEWEGKVLFIEPSEENMSEVEFERIIRNLGSQGILQWLRGILVGRSQLDRHTGLQINYDTVLLKALNRELWLTHIPVVSNMDFWHTDPMFVLPIWCEAMIDCDSQKFVITESACR